MRNSRWSIEGHKDERGRLIPVLFGPSDLEICKLLAPIRNPWGYQYLPTSYFHLLLNRGRAMSKRLDDLTDRPNCYIKRPEQPRNNYRDIVYSLDTKGADELRAAGFDVPRQHLRQLPHELMACLIAASFEYGAVKHNIPITPKEWPDQSFRPDWMTFIIGDTLVILEADTGSETIYSKEDATTISGKFINYLALIKDDIILKHFKVKGFIILFITTREARCVSMVDTLKKVIDEQDADHDVAEMAQNNKSAAKFRIGYVTATVWKNRDGFFNVDLVKSYKEGSDWKDTTSLSHGDLLNAMKVLERAEQFISVQR